MPFAAHVYNIRDNPLLCPLFISLLFSLSFFPVDLRMDAGDEFTHETAAFEDVVVTFAECPEFAKELCLRCIFGL